MVVVGGGGVEWNFSVQPRPKLNNKTHCTGGTGINTFYSPFLYSRRNIQGKNKRKFVVLLRVQLQT